MLKKVAPCLLLILALLACAQSADLTPTPLDRYNLLPAEKQSPASDPWPPVALAGWSQPEPLPFPVNTAGAEDSPFITPDNQTLYFFFTPDLRIPAEKQLLDGVTGIWVAHRTEAGWSEPRRIWLEKPGELALDGCGFVRGDELWFCTIRAGNRREIDIYTARWKDGRWVDWQTAGEPVNERYQVGELHLTADGRELYFGSPRAGGYGGLDLWVCRWTDAGWGEPLNLGPLVNRAGDENRPFVSADGQELWFDAPSQQGRPGQSVYLSTRQTDGSWGLPLEVISTFAGEPSLSGDGASIYFVHHYVSSDLNQMIEADIYVSHRLSP